MNVKPLSSYQKIMLIKKLKLIGLNLTLLKHTGYKRTRRFL